MFFEAEVLGQPVLEILLPALGVGEAGRYVGAVEADAAGDGLIQSAARDGGVGILVVELHGEGNEGVGDVLVGEGETAGLGDFFKVGGEAVEHGVGGNGGRAGCRVGGYADLVAQEVFEKVFFRVIRVVCISVIQRFVEHHLEQFG